jgi:hypothetical protein
LQFYIAALGSDFYNVGYVEQLESSYPRKWQQWVCDRSARTYATVPPEHLLPAVCPDIHTAYYRRIGAEVLLHRTSAAVLDRGAPLNVPEGHSGSSDPSA